LENFGVTAGKELPLNDMADYLPFEVDFIPAEVSQVIVLQAREIFDFGSSFPAYLHRHDAGIAVTDISDGIFSKRIILATIRIDDDGVDQAPGADDQFGNVIHDGPPKLE
jgi:hypothetical protein